MIVNNKSNYTKKIPNTSQYSIFDEVGDVQEIGISKESCDSNFLKPDSNSIFFGKMPLKKYLISFDLDWIITLRQLLADLDYSEFYRSYVHIGRKAIHPQVILGLLIYGIIEKKNSLRELEKLSSKDLGAMWITGGLCPDHSTIGKFINLHKQLLKENFFIELTTSLMKKLKLSSGDVAGDGTVIAAVSSRYRMITKEAAEQAALEANKKAEENPNDKKAAEKAEEAKKLAERARELEEKREKKGRKKSTIQISPTEPESVLQPQKRGGFSPSYKPSLLTDDNRFILGFHVHPSCETEAVPHMLAQYIAIHGCTPETVLLDAGYHSAGLLRYFVDEDIDVLCPSGKLDGTGETKRASRKGKYLKTDFEYIEEKDCYKCPAGKELHRGNDGVDNKGRSFTRYRISSKICRVCPLKANCTTRTNGRLLRRYEDEEYKDAMNSVMSQPKARKKFCKRKSMVEPVFAELKERLGLKRFRRRGLEGVRLEWAIYCMAYNMKKAIWTGGFAFYACFTIENDGKEGNYIVIFGIFWSD